MHRQSCQEVIDEEYVSVWAQLLNTSREKIRALLNKEEPQLELDFHEANEETVSSRATEE